VTVKFSVQDIHFDQMVKAVADGLSAAGPEVYRKS
jgi:hypothetical protein